MSEASYQTSPRNSKGATREDIDPDVRREIQSTPRGGLGTFTGWQLVDGFQLSNFKFMSFFDFNASTTVIVPLLRHIFELTLTKGSVERLQLLCQCRHIILSALQLVDNVGYIGLVFGLAARLHHLQLNPIIE